MLLLLFLLLHQWVSEWLSGFVSFVHCSIDGSMTDASMPFYSIPIPFHTLYRSRVSVCVCRTMNGGGTSTTAVSSVAVHWSMVGSFVGRCGGSASSSTEGTWSSAERTTEFVRKTTLVVVRWPVLFSPSFYSCDCVRIKLYVCMHIDVKREG